MKYLFNNEKFHNFADSLSNALENTINAYDKITFDTSTLDVLAERLLEEYKIALPVLKEDAIYQNKPLHTKIKYGERAHSSRSNTVDGTEYTLKIPFSGDATLFSIAPSSYSATLPYGTIETDEIKIVYKIPVNQDAFKAKKDFEDNLASIKMHLEFLEKDVYDFNNKLISSLKIQLKQRKEKLEKDHEMACAFGFPIR